MSSNRRWVFCRSQQPGAADAISARALLGLRHYGLTPVPQNTMHTMRPRLSICAQQIVRNVAAQQGVVGILQTPGYGRPVDVKFLEHTRTRQRQSAGNWALMGLIIEPLSTVSRRGADRCVRFACKSRHGLHIRGWRSVTFAASPPDRRATIAFVVACVMFHSRRRSGPRPSAQMTSQMRWRIYRCFVPTCACGLVAGYRAPLVAVALMHVGGTHRCG